MNSCFTCKHRSKDLKNNWDQAPAYECGNPESFRHERMVLKGMTCHAYMKVFGEPLGTSQRLHDR